MIVVFPLGYGFANLPDRVGDLLVGAVGQQQVMGVFAGRSLTKALSHLDSIVRFETEPQGSSGGSSER